MLHNNSQCNLFLTEVVLGENKVEYQCVQVTGVNGGISLMGIY